MILLFRRAVFTITLCGPLALVTMTAVDQRCCCIFLDTARTLALIGQVTERDASLGRALNTLATQFDYEGLLKLLEREPSHPGQTL